MDGGWTDGWVGGPMNLLMGGLVDEYKDGQPGGWTDGSMGR